MTKLVKMTALQSRSAGSSPTRSALARGATYSVPEEQARTDEARGFGARIAEADAKPAARRETQA